MLFLNRLPIDNKQPDEAAIICRKKEYGFGMIRVVSAGALHSQIYDSIIYHYESTGQRSSTCLYCLLGRVTGVVGWCDGAG